ncbi:MAG: hypothetical protein JXA71_16680 [Chitinispirillaceae bacterium]|nr:hypothetical protein [Chitinispirillaceae bacterium]
MKAIEEQWTNKNSLWGRHHGQVPYGGHSRTFSEILHGKVFSERLRTAGAIDLNTPAEFFHLYP